MDAERERERESTYTHIIALDSFTRREGTLPNFTESLFLILTGTQAHQSTNNPIKRIPRTSKTGHHPHTPHSPTHRLTLSS